MQFSTEFTTPESIEDTYTSLPTPTLKKKRGRKPLNHQSNPLSSSITEDNENPSGMIESSNFRKSSDDLYMSSSNNLTTATNTTSHSIVSESSNNNNKLRSTRSTSSVISGSTDQTSAPNLQHILSQYPNMDPKLLEMKFPKEYENAFATAIFELGLKHSSPKILIPLMPTTNAELSTEHIKSHLQKYRIHQKRSKEEFEFFYRTHVQESFHDWEKNRGWESITIPSSSVINDSAQLQKQNSDKLKVGYTSSNSSLNEFDLANAEGIWIGNESKESGNPHPLDSIDEDEEPIRKIRKLQQLKDSLTATITMIEDIKSLGKMAADDCSRFSKNLQSMINI
eukprot:gene1979-2115_t